MTEKPRLIEMRPPVQCVLWKHPERFPKTLAEIFDEIASYEDTNHSSRSLHRCRECGQLYFYEWFAWDDWEGGNDRSYSTFVPVQGRTSRRSRGWISSASYNTFRACTHLGGKPEWVGVILRDLFACALSFDRNGVLPYRPDAKPPVPSRQG